MGSGIQGGCGSFIFIKLLIRQASRNYSNVSINTLTQMLLCPCNRKPWADIAAWQTLDAQIWELGRGYLPNHSGMHLHCHLSLAEPICMETYFLQILKKRIWRYKANGPFIYIYDGWGLSHGSYFFPSHLNDDATKLECPPASMALVVCWHCSRGQWALLL